MNNIFIGFIFVFLDFNFDSGAMRIGLIPDFIGYILIYQGLKELSGQSKRFNAALPAAVGMAVYTAILYALDLLGVSFAFPQPLPFFLGLVSTALSLYISWCIVKGVADLEEGLGQNLNARNLYNVWVMLAALSIAIYALYLVPVLNVLCIIAGLVVGIVFLVTFNRTKNLYYGG